MNALFTTVADLTTGLSADIQTVVMGLIIIGFICMAVALVIRPLLHAFEHRDEKENGKIRSFTERFDKETGPS